MPAVYASVDTLSWFVNLNDYSPSDITVHNLGWIPDGAYRRVDPEFLAWVRDRIALAQKNPRIDFERVAVTALWYYDILDASGLEPALSAPADYVKPQAVTVDPFSRKFLHAPADPA